MSLLGDRLRRLTRLIVIVNLLQSGSRVTLVDLAAACGCCTKTIQRDLTYLQEAGVAYYYDPALRSYTLLSPVPLVSVQFSVARYPSFLVFSSLIYFLYSVLNQ